MKSPAITFSPTQGKTANSVVTKSLKMKYPTAKSLKVVRFYLYKMKVEFSFDEIH